MTVIHPKKRQNLGNELKFRTTRIRAFVWLGKNKEAIAGYCFVSDIKKKGAQVFITRKLPISGSALIAFDKEDNLPFQTKIVANKSIGDNNPEANRKGFHWKCSFAFQFGSDEESKRYLGYYDNLRSRVAMLAPEIKQPDYKIKEGSADDALSGDDIVNDLTAPASAPEAPAAEAAEPAPADAAAAAAEAPVDKPAESAPAESANAPSDDDGKKSAA